MRRRGLQAQIEIFELHRGPEVLARLQIAGHDKDWWFANIYPTPLFETIRPLFREPADDEDSKMLREQLREQNITMHVLDHHVLEFTMIVDGTRACLKFDKVE